MKELTRQTLGALVALAMTLACGGSEPSPQPPPAPEATGAPPPSTEAAAGDASTQVLKELITGFAQAHSPEWLQANATRIDPEVTKRALSLAYAMASEDPDKLPFAYAAFSIAAVGLARMGNHAKAVEANYNAARTAYMLINDPNAYAGLRLHCLELVKEAASVNELQLAAHAATLAADCSYFGSALAVQPTREVADQVMSDWIEAAKLMVSSSHSPQGGAFEDFASLAGALARDALAAYSKGQAADTRIIREFAALTERSIPADFQFRETSGDDKTAALHVTLAELSQKYGNRKVAAKRAGTGS